MNINKEELQEVVRTAVSVTLTEHRSIDEETHRDHHRFINEMIEEKKIKKERREKIKTQVLGWSIIATLGGIGKWAYHFFFR